MKKLIVTSILASAALFAQSNGTTPTKPAPAVAPAQTQTPAPAKVKQHRHKKATNAPAVKPAAPVAPATK